MLSSNTNPFSINILLLIDWGMRDSNPHFRFDRAPGFALGSALFWPFAMPDQDMIPCGSSLDSINRRDFGIDPQQVPVTVSICIAGIHSRLDESPNGPDAVQLPGTGTAQEPY